MSNAPDVSVIIPCYRQAHLLGRAVQSVAVQQGAAIEIIVVDDGSPDDVPAACNKSDERITLIRQNNAGLATARNAGIAAAKGELLHFLDADDTVLPGIYCTALRRLGGRDDMVWVCGNRLQIDGSQRHLDQLPPHDGRLFPSLAREGLFPVSAVILPVALARRTALFDPSLPAREDWDFWLQIARTGAWFRSDPRPFFAYHLYPASMSSGARAMYEGSCTILERSSTNDPRVQNPDPDFAAGIPDLPIETLKVRYALESAAKAFAAGHWQVVEDMLAEVASSALSEAISDESWSAVHALAALASGHLPTDHDSNADLIAQRLLELGAHLQGRSMHPLLSELCRRLVLGEDVDRWRRSYLRLAGATPIRQLLALRRFLHKGH